MMVTINYGESQITFELVRKNVKHINVTVQPNQAIFVSANEHVDIEEIKSFVQSKGRWILSKLHYFKRHAPYKKNPRDYVTGETFRYLGRQYKLRVIEGKEAHVRYFRGTIEMYVNGVADFSKKERLMEAWYDQRRHIIFYDSLRRIHELVKI